MQFVLQQRRLTGAEKGRPSVAAVIGGSRGRLLGPALGGGLACRSGLRLWARAAVGVAAGEALARLRVEEIEAPGVDPELGVAALGDLGLLAQPRDQGGLAARGAGDLSKAGVGRD